MTGSAGLDGRIMNYEEARVYLDSISKYGSVLGLDNMKELLGRLGDPQNDLKFIHISGTNGKGSVLAYLSTVLSASGYRTGRYLSPTLFSYRERIQVDGERIEKEALARMMTRIRDAAEAMAKEGKGQPTVFEQETALSFLYFREKECDLVVLETGLGGTLDATNVITTGILEVIAPIGMDHIGVLGNTLEEIAENKAGIIKPHTCVVSAVQEPAAAAVITRVCREQRCSVTFVEAEALKNVCYGYEKQIFSYKEWKNIEISLAGSYQVENAALALDAVEALCDLGYGLPEATVRTGFLETQWRGRFTVLGKDPVFILDGAHNPPAAKVLRESLELYFAGRNLYYIFGVFSDKDYRKVIEITAPLAKHIVTVQTPGNSRALPAEELLKEVKKVQPDAQMADSISEAVEKCLGLAEKEDVIVAFGSLSYLGEVDKAYHAAKEK